MVFFHINCCNCSTVLRSTYLTTLLVWFNPRYRIVTKLIVTIVVIAVTIWAFYLTANMYT